MSTDIQFNLESNIQFNFTNYDTIFDYGYKYIINQSVSNLFENYLIHNFENLNQKIYYLYNNTTIFMLPDDCSIAINIFEQ